MYKKLLSIVLFFSLSVAYTQEQDSKNESDYKKEVKATILKFFEGFHSNDTLKMRKTMDETMVLQTIKKRKSGGKKAIVGNVDDFLTTVKNRPTGQLWDERLLDFKIETDGRIANVWTPYEFYFNGTFSHCGVNVFQVYNDGISWRIIALADTRHREGCKSID